MCERLIVTGKQDMVDVDVDDTDHEAKRLLDETKSDIDWNALSFGEEFNADTVVVLLGLGLTGEEVRLFQTHQIGLDKLKTLTSSDLDYIGIKSAEKKNNVMACIAKMRRENPSPGSTSESGSSGVFRPEDIQALENVYRHQQTLIKILPYMKKYVTSCRESTFFQTGISSNHTFEHVTACCVQQATEAHQQLQRYLQEFNEGTIPKKWYLRLYLPRKRLFLSLILGSCVSFAMWCFKK